MLDVQSEDHDHNSEELKPIKKLGFGITAYVSLLERSFYLFFILSIFAAVIMWSYYKADPKGIYS